VISHPNLAAVAALIGEPSRAAMLVELLDGRALTATELAVRAAIAPSTASDHLGRLLDGGLLSCLSQGRHRYYRLASPRVARVLEALGVLASPTSPRDRFEAELLEAVRFARSCYDHLAGWLGVTVADALLARQLLRDEAGGFQLTPVGERWCAELGLDLAGAHHTRRAFARGCLDWSERRLHLAGSLGAALLARLLELGWLERIKGERALQLTPAGQAGLQASLGLQLPAAAAAAS
jgi:DNA-binding transcriptional ArsR family regulator